MALNVYYREDVARAILAGVMLAISAHGQSDDYMAGVLAMAQHQAVTFGLPWPAIVQEAKILLEGGNREQ